MQSRQIFFKELDTFWGLHPLYNKNNTLLIDDSFYKVSGNPQGTWLLVPQLYNQPSKERLTFLEKDLRDWLFLWLQNEDRQEYTSDNAFEETPDQFSDDVMKKLHEENQSEIDNRRR